MARVVRAAVVVTVVILLALTTPTHQKLITTTTTTTTNTPVNGLEDSPLTEVVGVVGRQVLLPCDFDPPLSNDSTHLVLFYRSGAGTPIYSIDARNVGLEGGSHWAEGGLGGRAYVRLDRGHRGLVLEELKLSDRGHYRCRVDFVESPTKNTRIRLTVIEPPRRLTVTSDYSPESKIGRVAGPFPEGAEVTLSCQVLGGEPRPQVSWWHEGSLLDDVSEVQTGQVTRNALSLPPLTRADLNNTLTCQATNSNLTIPLSHAVTIDMIYAPTWVEVERDVGGSLRVQEGVARVVSCEARGARPPARIQWLLDGKPLTQHTQETVSGEISRSTLTLVPEPRQHGLPLTCLAFTPAYPLTHHTITSVTKLQVLYKPRLELRVEPHRDLQEVEEGEDVTFVCHIDAHPPVTGVQWARDGVPVQMAAAGVPERLLLRGVTRDDSGGYTCAAANTEGARTSNALTLAVKFPPTCQQGQQTVYGAARHEELHVPCSVLAHPPPSSFRWAVNTTTGVVDVALNLSSITGGRSVVRYTPQTHHDFGELLCWAVNDIGLQQAPCVFKVLPAAKPESVRECRAERNSTMPASYVVLACIAGWDGGLNQTFTLEVRQAAREQVLEAFRHAAEPFFIITGLQMGVQYLLTVTAANARGSSLPITVNYTATTAAADKVVSPHAHTHTIFSLAALLLMVAGVVVVVACVSVGVVAARRRGGRRHGRTQSAKMLYGGGSLKEDLEHNGVHTIVCVKECEKEEVVRSHPPSGVVGNLYVTPSSLLNNRGLVAPQETDVLLQERPPCPPLTSLDSLGRCSTSTSKTSTSSASSAATVALNPDFLAKNPEYMARNPNYKNPDSRPILPDFVMQSLDRMSIAPEYFTNACDCGMKNLDVLAAKSECPAAKSECPAAKSECPAANHACAVRNPPCCAREGDYLAVNLTCAARYPDCVGREEASSLIPPHRESSV